MAEDNGTVNGESPVQAPGSEHPKLLSVHLKNFTAFTDFSMDFSPGVNAIIGENATGKTHLMKITYVLSTADRSKQLAPQMPLWSATELREYFSPAYEDQWNIVNRKAKPRTAIVSLKSDLGVAELVLEDHGGSIRNGGYQTRTTVPRDLSESHQATFVPAKEIISVASGFLSSYLQHGISFEKEYVDLVAKCVGQTRLMPKSQSMQVMQMIEGTIGGQVDSNKDEKFFLVQQDWRLEMSMVAEGHRKLAQLWLLLRNGHLTPGSILFWDEPEANLNPQLMDEAIEIILELSRIGVQVFFATHSYVMLKELDLRARADDQVMYHALYRETADAPIQCESQDSFLKLAHNKILDKYTELYREELSRAADRMRNGNR